MTTNRRFRLFPALMLLALTVLGGPSLAYANAPSDTGPFPLLSLPDCAAAAPDTGGAHICKVRAAAIGTEWRAGTGEWVVIRAGDGEPDQASCLAVQASVVATITIDGKKLPVDTTPCAFLADSGLWFVDYRALSHPLPSGVRAIVETLFVTTAASGFPAGTTITFSTTLTVAQHG